MDWLIWIMFESAVALAAVLGTVLFALLVYWRRGGSPRPLLIGLVVLLVLLILQPLVVTRREHAGRIMSAIEQDIVAARTDALAAALAPGFHAGRRDADAFVAFVRAKMQQIDVHWLERQSLRLEPLDSPTSDCFAVSVGYLADVANEYEGTIPSRWQIEFTRTPAGWKISTIHCLRLAWLENPTWTEIDRR